jgi:hypothetical protein
MSAIETMWESTSKKSFGAPPVKAELWNTGLVSCGRMKVIGALTPAAARGVLARGDTTDVISLISVLPHVVLLPGTGGAMITASAGVNRRMGSTGSEIQ